MAHDEVEEIEGPVIPPDPQPEVDVHTVTLYWKLTEMEAQVVGMVLRGLAKEFGSHTEDFRLETRYYGTFRNQS